jgi:hypothetical protein
VLHLFLSSFLCHYNAGNVAVTSILQPQVLMSAL